MQAIGNEVYRLDPSKKNSLSIRQHLRQRSSQSLSKKISLKNSKTTTTIWIYCWSMTFNFSAKAIKAARRVHFRTVWNHDSQPQTNHHHQRPLPAKFGRHTRTAAFAFHVRHRYCDWTARIWDAREHFCSKKPNWKALLYPRSGFTFIAQLLRANVRELEGALRKVIAYCTFTNAPIDLPNTKMALKDLLSKNQEHISIESIQKIVADFYKIKVADMYSTKRPKKIAEPIKSPCIWPKSWPKKFARNRCAFWRGRDHTTVLHACRKNCRAQG